MARIMRKRAPRSAPSIKLIEGVPIDYKDLETLEKCVGSQGQIMHRKRSGLSSQRQKELKKAIKRARHVGLLPFVG